MTPRKTQGKSQAGAPAAAEPSFEALLERLQAIVAELEQGEQPLERSVALFEEGMALARGGMARLDAAEQRVQILVEADGELREVDLPAAGAGPGDEEP